MCAFTTAEIDAQIASLKTQLTENMTAISASRMAMQQSLDTGQTRQSVTRHSLNQLYAERNAIREELDYWCALKGDGSGGFTARPAW